MPSGTKVRLILPESENVKMVDRLPGPVDIAELEQLNQQLAQESRGWTPDGSAYTRWFHQLENLISRCYPSDSRTRLEELSRIADYRRAIRVTNRLTQHTDPSRRDETEFRSNLPRLQEYVSALLVDLEQRSKVAGANGHLTPQQRPSVFIAHGGDSRPLEKVREFLEALGMNAVEVEKVAVEGKSIDEIVTEKLQQADCAIMLATKGDIDGKTGGFIPRGNTLIELGRFQERFPQKTIYLLEKGAEFPTNAKEKVRERFTSRNMERAFIRIARELSAFGLLRASKR